MDCQPSLKMAERFTPSEKGKPGHSHQSGQWSQRVTAIWQGLSLPRPDGFGSLTAAVDHYSPPISYRNGHLPNEAPPARDPRIDHRTQELAQIIDAQGKFVLEATGLTTDLNLPR